MPPFGASRLRSGVFLPGQGRLAAKIVQVVVGDQRPAAAVLDRLQLEARPAEQLAAIGDGILDRRELEKIILARPWSL